MSEDPCNESKFLLKRSTEKLVKRNPITSGMAIIKVKKKKCKEKINSEVTKRENTKILKKTNDSF